MGREAITILVTVAISVPVASLLTWLISWAAIGSALTKRVEDLGKRNDRMERVLPPAAFGIWALLRIHVAERNGSTDPDVKKAYDGLQEVIFPAIVSQKAQP